MLTQFVLTNAKPREKDHKLSDGDGLYLLIKTSGSKLWRQKYRFAGKEKTLSHGSFPEVEPLRRERNAAMPARYSQGARTQANTRRPPGSMLRRPPPTPSVRSPKSA